MEKQRQLLIQAKDLIVILTVFTVNGLIKMIHQSSNKNYLILLYKPEHGDLKFFMSQAKVIHHFHQVLILRNLSIAQPSMRDLLFKMESQKLFLIQTKDSTAMVDGLDLTKLEHSTDFNERTALFYLSKEN